METHTAASRASAANLPDRIAPLMEAQSLEVEPASSLGVGRQQHLEPAIDDEAVHMVARDAATETIRGFEQANLHAAGMRIQVSWDDQCAPAMARAQRTRGAKRRPASETV